MISVVMPVHNGARFLDQAIRSVLAQSHEDLELIVVDDGSTDETQQILDRARVADGRVRVFRQPHRGVSAARNRALSEARGEWVANLDSDDRMLPERLERQARFAAAHPDARVFACRAFYISELGKTVGRTPREPFTTAEQFRLYVDGGGIIGFNHSSAMMHRETILSVGGYREQFRSAEDLDLWNRVVDAGHLVLLQDELLVEYRLHPGSIVGSRMSLVLMDWEWMKACLRARRASQPEPSREEFLELWHSRPLGVRARSKIKHAANLHYRAAALSIAHRSYAAGMGHLALSAMLRPVYVARRLHAQMFDRASSA